MRSTVPLFLLALTLLAGQAADIVAWKVPMSRYASGDWQTEGAVRLRSAPEESPFFKDGDELWNLNGIDVEHKEGEKKAEWVVWNASTGRLVAKGDWAQITTIHERLRIDEMAKHCRVKLSLVPVADASEIPGHDSKAVAAVSVVSRSGQKATASWSGGGYDVSVETEVTIGESDQIVDLRLVWNSKSADQPGFQVNTALTMRSVEPIWVARDFDGIRGFDLIASAVLETVDGTPVGGRMLIQNGKRTESLMSPPGFTLSKTEAVGDSGWLTRIILTPRTLGEILSIGNTPSQTDPFAEPNPVVRNFIPVGGSMKPPEVLKALLDHEVLDARAWLGKCGIDVKDDEFLGYDPLREMLYFYSPHPSSSDLLVALFSTLDGQSPPHVIVTSSEGKGQSRLIAKAGQKASIFREVGDKEPFRSFEIEPTLGETEDIVDLRFFYENKTDTKESCVVNSMATLQVGEWLEVASGTLGDGKSIPLRLKAEVYRATP